MLRSTRTPLPPTRQLAVWRDASPLVPPSLSNTRSQACLGSYISGKAAAGMFGIRLCGYSGGKCTATKEALQCPKQAAVCAQLPSLTNLHANGQKEWCSLHSGNKVGCRVLPPTSIPSEPSISQPSPNTPNVPQVCRVHLAQAKCLSSYISGPGDSTEVTSVRLCRFGISAACM